MTTSSSSVYDFHPDYLHNVKSWETANDVFQKDVLRKGEKYLLKPSHVPSNASHASEINKAIDDDFTLMTEHLAVFYDFSSLTLDGVVGLIMAKPPVKKFSKEKDGESHIDYLTVNADGRGNGLNQVAKMLIYGVELFGQSGVLIDVPEAASAADIVSGDKVPRLKFYSALNIVNWNTEYQNGREILDYLVLREYVRGSHSDSELVERVIIFELENKVCKYKIYLGGKLEKGDVQLKNGSPADSIPFHRAGAKNNDWLLDSAPMKSLIKLNMLHYNMLFRDMTSRYKLGQIQLHVDIGTSETPEKDFTALNPGGVIAGSNSAVITANGGAVKIIQASESNLLSTAPEEIKKMAVEAGAQLFSSSGSNETATAANIRASYSSATISSVANNVSDCLFNAIVEIGEYINSDNIKVDIDEIKFQLNTDFETNKLTAQELKDYTFAVQQGTLSMRAMYDIQKKSGVINEKTSFDDYLDELRESKMGGMPSIN